MKQLREYLSEGHVIPAMPLALTEDGEWTTRHQRALLRYYFEAGAGGLAVGVHSTQFEIRDKHIGLFEPVLEFAAKELDKMISATGRDFVKIAGVCGEIDQALREARFVKGLGYDAALLSLAALKNASLDELVEHCRVVATEIPIIGFYLQPIVGGRVLPYEFWKEFLKIQNVVAIKIAPFNRYQTWDVVRALAESGRDDVSLYTGNDDNIIADLLTPWDYAGRRVWIVGGLLGQFGVWTHKAASLLREIKLAREQASLDITWLSKNAALTDANGVVFDAANKFSGCIPGIHEILRRQGLMASTRCLNPHEKLSPGQSEEISRIYDVYPWLVDDEFVEQNIERWLKD